MRPYYDHAGVTIYHGDCHDLLSWLPGDVIVTDPPYGTGGWRRPGAGRGRHPGAQLERETWDVGDVGWIDGRRPVLSFWPSSKARLLLERADAVGLVKHRALYMVKHDPKPQVAGRVAWAVEPIWVISRPGFVLRGGVDWIGTSTPRLGRDADATVHPYQKPLEVMKWLVCKTEGLILDPFAGSGTTLLACKDLGRRVIGVEQDERYCELAAKRCAQEVLAL